MPPADNSTTRAGPVVAFDGVTSMMPLNYTGQNRLFPGGVMFL